MALVFYPTIPRFKTTPVVSDINVSSPLHEVTGQPFQGHSLGGHRAWVPLENRFLSLFQKKSYLSHQPVVVALDPLSCVLFDDLSDSQRTAGKTDYRVIAYMHNGDTSDYSSVTVGLNQPSAATISVWKPTKNSDGSVDEIADELTAPAGAVWSTPTLAAPLSLGSLNRNTWEFLWIKRVVAAAATATPYDAAILEFRATDASGTVTTFQLIPFWTLKNTAYSLEISEAFGREIGLCGIKGMDLNLTVKDSSGTKVDPPGNLILVSVSVPPMFGPEYPEGGMVGGDYLKVRTGVYQARAAKLSTGDYFFPFRPPTPGHYLLHFDVGGVFSVVRRIEVSPVE